MKLGKMKDNNNIDKAIREKLNGFSVPPPINVWGKLQGQLAAQQRKKRILYYRWVSAAAVIVLAIIGGWYFGNNANSKVQMQAGQTNRPVSEREITVGSEKQNNDSRQAINPKPKIFIPGPATKSHIIQNRDAGLVAVSSKEFENIEEVLKTSDRKKDNIKRIKSINARVDNGRPELYLAVRTTTVKEYTLTEADKFLMASNTNVVNKKTRVRKSWKMGMYVSPGYSSQVVNHSDSYSKNMNSTGESGNGNIGGGFSIQYKTTKKLSIESGVYYAQNGQSSAIFTNFLASNNREFENVGEPNSSFDYMASTAPLYSNAVSLSNGNIVMNGNAGEIKVSADVKGIEITARAEATEKAFSSTLVTDGEISQVFDFIEIPLFLRYSVLDSKFGIELMGGVNTGIVVGNNVYVDNSYGVQNIGSTQDISSVNLSGTVGVGMNYDLGKHVSVAIEPRLNYYFKSINSNPNVDFRPYRIAFFTGVYYAF